MSRGRARGPERSRTGVDRRTVLKLAGGAAVLPAFACSPPREEIVPYVDMPEGEVPGRPRYYATALPLTGYAAPVVVESHQGRPTKVEGNARHPASGGATDAFAQAAVLSLYDPERARAPVRRGAPGEPGEIASWDAFLGELEGRRAAWARDGGAGLRLLTEPLCSPTLAAQVAALLRRYPAARWHGWTPVNEDAARQGAIMAFGRPLQALPDLAAARAVLTLDADPLGPGPQQVARARALAAARAGRQAAAGSTRLYAAEAAMSLTGAAADHRLALRPGDIAVFAAALAAALGAAPYPAGGAERLDPRARRFLAAVAEDLQAAGPAALVLAGRSQPPEVHALAHCVNDRLGAIGRTVALVEPLQDGPALLAPSIAALAEDMAAGRVGDLVVIGGNPALDAPGELGFAAALAALPSSIRLSPWPDETAALSRWHLPEHHPLETWSDARGVDGRVSLVQPLLRPLFDSRSAHELLAALDGRPSEQGHDILRAQWRGRLPPLQAEVRDSTEGFDTWWREALKAGFIPGTGPAAVAPPPARPPAAMPPSALPDAGISLLFRPDPALWDGRFAGNAWLQELPQPFSKLTWGNALHLPPADAGALGLDEGDLARLVADGAALELPVVHAPGQAPGTAVVHLGHGRSHAGRIGSGIGVDVYPLRRSDTAWRRDGVVLATAGGQGRLARTQEHFSQHDRDIVREIDLAALARMPEEGEGLPASLYPERPQPAGPQAWGMVIDQTACIGCNACVTACQAENNIPVVGPDEIAMGRSMHWLRIDTYYAGPPDAGHGTGEVADRPLFQPVPCMHCEKAPCEPVCPVAASVHSESGLNAQVYNRCIGTRDCQSTCPYQVRRFNFRGYAMGQAYANLDDPLYQARRNPNVSVRPRGVMEKCTYCVQRISAARRDAEAAGRPLRDGAVATACQAACPTSAIAFGDLQDPGSEVVRQKALPHNYALLGDLGTRPRTTYLARLRDTNPALAPGAAEPEDEG